MPLLGFAQFRNFLSFVSGQRPIEQMDFVRQANAPLGSPVLDSGIAQIREASQDLLTMLSPGRSQAPDSVRWIRWEDPFCQSGVGLLLAGPKSPYLMLPEGTDPLALRFTRPIVDKLLMLLPNLETLERSSGERLAYVHKDQLQINLRPPDDLRRYARFLKMEQNGLLPFPVSFHHWSNDPLSHGIEDIRGGPHQGILAVQKGMDYLLGELTRGYFSQHAVSLTAAAKVYPAPDILLRPPFLNALPDDSCFGAGDPLFRRLQIDVNDRKLFWDGSGKPIGWARIVAGVLRGRYGDPVSGISAATSVGGRTNQEDGFYVAHFRSHDGRDVRVLIGADGLGGNELGEMASSAALQGAHAAILRAILERRTPLADELLDAARDALEAQTLLFEAEREKPFPDLRQPDTVLSVVVVIDGHATIATTGDFLVALFTEKEDGTVEAVGYAPVDAENENVVNATLRSGRKRLSQKTLPPKSWLVALSDGAMEGLSPFFKKRASPAFREQTGSAFPDRAMFYNLQHILQHAPRHFAGIALHNAAGGDVTIPTDAPNGAKVSYPALGVIDPETDNWTAVSLYWEGSSLKDAAPALPPVMGYSLLQTVYPPFQYVYEETPSAFEFPEMQRELFLGNRFHPESRPMIVIADPGLKPQHVRIERVVKGIDETFFLEKLTGAGRIVLLDKNDRKVASLRKKGARYPIQAGHVLRLNPHTSLRFRGL